MKAFLDFIPILCFFITFKCAGNYTEAIQSIISVSSDMVPIVSATLVIIFTSVLQMALTMLRGQRPSKTLLLSTGLVVIFGGLTVFLQDATFIMWKPSILYWLFAAVLVFSRYRGDNLMQKLLATVTMAPKYWRQLENLCIGFLLFIGIVNLAVAYSFPLDIWVDFKLFGLLGLTIIFTIILGYFITKHGELADNATK